MAVSHKWGSVPVYETARGTDSVGSKQIPACSLTLPTAVDLTSNGQIKIDRAHGDIYNN
jgi:hypothetical protein